MDAGEDRCSIRSAQPRRAARQADGAFRLTRPHILGAVLAGERSSRFGSDKALAQLAGRPLIEHAVAALLPYVAKVVVCGRIMADGSGIADRPATDLGPLGGLNAALHQAASQGYGGVLTLGCDMPLLPASAALALLGDEPAYIEGQQLVGYWPSALAAALDAHLAEEGDRSIRRWIDSIAARAIAHPPLPNVNRRENLAALER